MMLVGSTNAASTTGLDPARIAFAWGRFTLSITPGPAHNDQRDQADDQDKSNNGRDRHNATSLNFRMHQNTSTAPVAASKAHLR